MIVPPAPEAAGLYLIVDPRDTTACGADLERVRAAFRGGVQWAQIRMKGAGTDEIVAAWRQVHPLAREFGVGLVINDDVDAALRIGADGVHLGQVDLARGGGSFAEVRARVGASMWIGVSTHSAEQARAAIAAGADYLGFGAMFKTASKDAAYVIGPGSLAVLAELGPTPVFAIGGIGPGNIAEITARGVGRVAVSAAILQTADPEGVARELRAALVSAGSLGAPGRDERAAIEEREQG